MNMTFTELKDNLSYMYRDFFEDMKIDSKTGIVIGNNLRFTGFPYIGRNYVTAPIKLLFVPLDTGKDECFKIIHIILLRIEKIYFRQECWTSIPILQVCMQQLYIY